MLKKPWLLVPYDELIIPVDEVTIVAVRGTATGEWKVTAEPTDAVQLDFDPRQRMLRLRGCKVADGSLSIRCGDAMLKVPMRIRLRAARLKRTPVALLSGAQVPADFVREAAENALLNAIERQPRSYVRYELSGISAMDAMSDGLVTARILATGDDYLPLDLETSVRIARVDLPRELATKLVFSNDPEKVSGEHVLSYGMLPSVKDPVRLVYHHTNAGKQSIWLRLELFNATDQLVHIVTRFAYSGPTRDEIHAGHTAVASFLQRWYNRASFLLTIPPRSVYIAAEHPLPPDGVVSGIWELTPTNSVQGAIGYQLRTVAQTAQGRIQPLNMALPVTLNVRWKIFDEPIRHTKAIHEVVGKWAFIHIGREPLRVGSGRHQLRGNYGVIYHAIIEVRNNRKRSSWSELVFTPNGGIARAAVLVDGELIQAPPLAPPREAVLKRWRIPAHSVQQHEIWTMPAPGSNYPVSIIIRSP
ncbi:TPA: hypothetical protein EYP84_01540 [Candidatus Bipolaricaulota bacterium]|nr:hypothetical protein [Candidatus Bipolaricaulota bacterium]